MNKNIKNNINKTKISVVSKLKMLKNIFPKNNNDDIKRKNGQINSIQNNKTISNKSMTLEDLERELEFLKQEREEILRERYTLTQNYCDDKRFLELYPVTGPISKMKADLYSQQLEEDEENLKWYSDSLKVIDDVINEIEEVKKTIIKR